MRALGRAGAGRVSRPFAVASALAVATAHVPPATAQAPPTAAQVTPATAEAVVTLSADTIGLGDVFDLHVVVEVPPGSAVYFPDTVSTAFALESFRPATWSAESAGNGALLTLTYPLIAFRVGLAPVPGLDVYIGAGADVAGERLPGGSVVGSWSDVETGTATRASLTRAAVPRREVWVASVIVLEDLTSPLQPRPPADVIGPGWNRLAVATILALSVLLLAVARSVAATLLPDRQAEEPLGTAPPQDSASVRWQKALDELDRILALGLHTDGRTDEFYGRSSAVVRTFVEGFDADWHPGLTSSELMCRLEAWTNGSAPDLYTSMHTAEVVKFGRLRPDAGTAAGHWKDLKNWVQASRSIEP